MSKASAIAAVILAGSFVPAFAFAGEPIITPSMVDKLEDTQRPGQPSSETYLGNICVSASRCVEISFDITNKGNGVLRFPGGWIRIYDTHQDEDETPPGLLRNELVDLNNDGFLDIDSAVAWFYFNPETGCFDSMTDPPVPVLFGRAPCTGAN